MTIIVHLKALSTVFQLYIFDFITCYIDVVSSTPHNRGVHYQIVEILMSNTDIKIITEIFF